MAQTPTTRSVGRPRQFDEEAALEAAMGAFWARGYEATSMADLCACTGLHKGSLYQAFGDKRKLFLTALKHYADKQFRDVASVAFRSDSPLANIKAAVKALCDHAKEDAGCLVVNSMVELAPHDPDVREAVSGFAEQRVRFMADMIGKAQQAGELSTGQDPKMLAQQLMLTVAGGSVLMKTMLNADEIQRTLENLVDSWV